MTENLVLITGKFPYGKYETFLETEILYLADEFDSIVILPTKIDGAARKIPGNVEVTNELAEFLSGPKKNKIINLISGTVSTISVRDFYRRIQKQPKRYLHPKGFKRLCLWANHAKELRNFFSDFLNNHEMDNDSTLFYTYWFNLSTVGLGKSLKTSKLVTRVHGFDLFDERTGYPYTSWKCLGMNHLKQIFSISETGVHYLKKHYPEYRSLYSVSRLGVKHPGFTCQPSKKDSLKIVSVSSIIKIKRVHLVVDALQLLTAKFPDIDVTWDHFGDGRGGDLMNDLKNEIKNNIENMVKVTLHGRVPNVEVMEHYKKNSTDVFINVSKSEGIPVSIMEAQSTGVPVIATDVGGTSEIVNNENGYLLVANPSSEDVCDALADVVLNRKKWLEKRNKSKENWSAHYDADKNYADFARSLANLL